MRFVHNVWVVDRNDKIWWLTQTDTEEQAEEHRQVFILRTNPEKYRMTFIGMCSYENRAWAFGEPEWEIDYEDSLVDQEKTD